MRQFKLFHYKTLIFAALTALLLPAAFGQTPVVTVGTGANESYMLVDFEDGTAQPSYLFGYKYDGTRTAQDMVAALGAADAPAVGYVPGFEPGGSSPLGVAINSFRYDGHSEAGFEFTGYWSYYLKDDGDWEYSGVGVSSRPLFDGSYDGWAWDTGTDPLPRDPMAAPEPGPFSSLGLGCFLLAGVVILSRRKALSTTCQRRSSVA